MKLRHLIAIFTFLAAFGLSVFFVAVNLPKGCSAGASHIKNLSPADTETELQARIRTFLEADRQSGIEFANDMKRFSQSNSRIEAEEKATLNLARKMWDVKCFDLPDDFCMAWQEHSLAWGLMANHFDPDFKRDQLRGIKREDYGLLNEGISKSYEHMIATARKHGVDFRY